MRRFGYLLLGLLGSAVAAYASSTRPQMSAADAAQHQIQHYLDQGPSAWRPAELLPRQGRPDLVVALDGSGTHRHLQDAIDAIPDQPANAPPSRRWFIHVKPGEYRGPVCLKDKPPLTIYGSAPHAAATILVDSRFNGLPKSPDAAAQPCHPNSGAATHGTSGSATMIVASDDVQLAHITIANDATRSAIPPPQEGLQAVALMTRADKIQLENVRLLSYQDTFYVRRPSLRAPARVFVRASLIAGDVDFVFGNATLVIDDSTLLTRTGRLPPNRGGHVLAPSTPHDVRLGFLVTRSRFVSEAGATEGGTSLGRAWDEGVPQHQWRAEASPNGQALVRDSFIGPHIAGWAASTSGRSVDPVADQAASHAHRLSEFNNLPLPAQALRETLRAGEGWASEGAGTRGGSEAAPEDIHVVRSRKELRQALTPHPRPRIIQLIGDIDLSTDDDGRPLTSEDFAHPDFSWSAFAKAFDPASWGKGAPEGPLEEARRLSARAQAEHVLLKVPSQTTLIGVGNDARLVKGGLMLDQVSDIIIRNIRFSDAYDHFPAWDPRDNGHGEWNSEFDALTLKGARRVWIDHCTFDDGDHPDADEPMLLGRPMQRHDGLLDITRGSDLITVSWNHFRHHDKTSLIGGSDKHTADQGLLRVTYHHNWWEQTKERSPRVRYGAVHVVNNLYEVHDADNFGYSLGLGVGSSLLSQGNAWRTPNSVGPERLVRVLGGKNFTDLDSWHNGQAINLFDMARLQQPHISPLPPETPSLFPYSLPIEPASDVAARVRASAGAGRLWTDSSIP